MFFRFLFLSLLLCCFSCQPSSPPPSSGSAEETPEAKTGLYYQYSVLLAFENEIYDGELTVGELKTKGDLGLGSYDQVNGELIMLDGITYRADENGKVSTTQDDEKIVYANATFFDPEQNFTVDTASNYKSLLDQIGVELPSRNLFYAFKIHAHFNRLKVGTLVKQEKPYTEGMDVLIPNRPTFEREDFSGTMVGFFCPEFMGDVSIQGYHLHFVSDDKTFAGHVMEFDADQLEISIDHLYHYQFDLPTSDAYLEREFETDF